MDNQITPEIIAQATEVVCEECDHKVFEEKMMIRKISRLLIGADKDQVVPLPVICCAACGHINKEFQPKV